MAEIVGQDYIHPGGRYYKDGYSDGWRYKVKRGRKVWEEEFEPRLKLLVRRDYDLPSPKPTKRK